MMSLAVSTIQPHNSVMYSSQTFDAVYFTTTWSLDSIHVERFSASVQNHHLQCT